MDSEMKRRMEEFTSDWTETFYELCQECGQDINPDDPKYIHEQLAGSPLSFCSRECRADWRVKKQNEWRN